MFHPTAIINLSNFKNNIQYLKSVLGKSEIFPVVKANAYGHGCSMIVKALNEESVNTVCVATSHDGLSNLNDISSRSYCRTVIDPTRKLCCTSIVTKCK